MPHPRLGERLDTPMIERESILEEIVNAKRDIAEAEKKLERAIEEIQVNPRAQKTTVSKVVEDALAKVKVARTNLEKLEKSIEIDAS
jgi:hypothetical protein